jgi:ketosteroid isomerase-like protein
MTLELPGIPPIEERGKILQVLRQQPDGRWLIWRESFSADTPRSAPPPRQQ